MLLLLHAGRTIKRFCREARGGGLEVDAYHFFGILGWGGGRLFAYSNKCGSLKFPILRFFSISATSVHVHEIVFYFLFLHL